MTIRLKLTPRTADHHSFRQFKLVSQGTSFDLLAADLHDDISLV
jgi:hypothetical protein